MSEVTLTGIRHLLFRRRGGLNRVPYWLLLPSAVLLAVIVYLPMLFAFWVSLTGLNQYTIGDWIHAPFVGLQHYADTLAPGGALAGQLWGSVRASILFAVITTVLITPIGMGAALLLNQTLRARGVLRAIMLLPYIIPTFVNAILWRLIFMNGTGPADQLLAALHIAPQTTYWLIGPNSFWAMVIADVWASWPFIYLMALAALQTIPQDLYDAATVDGARSPGQFRHVTIPMIWRTVGLGLVLSTINHFNNFTLPFVMFGTAPPDQVNVLPLAIYVNSFVTFNFGLGAAMSVMALVIMLIPGVVYLRASRVGEMR